ncbi:MAG: carboxypeptidase-like regulatory domain-containing protein [Salinivirgaceae bacterium]
MKNLTNFGYFIVLICTICTNLYAQDNTPGRVTAAFKNTPLAIVLNKISDQTQHKIYFNDVWTQDINCTGNFKDLPLNIALDKILDKTPLLHIEINQIYYVVPRELVAQHLKKLNLLGSSYSGDDYINYTIIGNASDIGKYKINRITGVVKDGASGELLVGATVQVLNSSEYGVSGYTGKYALELPAGTYQIKTSSVGFESQLSTIKVLGPGKLDLELFEETHALDEVTILSDKLNKNVSRDQMSIVEMSAKEIKQLPSLIGERDIIKSFTTMPGVKTAGEFGSGINVRGGGEDQNLYLLENAPLFNTSHVMGLLSAVNPDAVTNVTLYKGHIPSNYGERVSSVMDINFNGSYISKASAKGGIGIYSSRLMAELPFFNEKVTLKLGGRASYSDWLLTKLPDYYLQNSAASFADLNGVLSINLKKNPITLFAYFSNDKFDYAKIQTYQYGNKLLSANWQHIFGPTINTAVNLAYSNYAVTNQNFETVLFSHQVKSDITYLSGKIKTEYSGFYNQNLILGIQGIQYQINPGERTPIGNAQVEPFSTRTELGREFSAFINDVITFSPSITFQLGLRFTIYQYLQTSSNKELCSYQGLEPRASIKYQLTETNAVKASFNRNQQFLTLLSYTSISTPDDVWKLADPNLRPIIADQVALGYYQNFQNNTLEFSAEIYYKKLQHLSDYKNGAVLKLNNQVTSELLDVRGKNYGLEFMLKKSSGNLFGSVAYTFSKALRATHGESFQEQINKNQSYPSQFDIPHDLNLNLNYKINRRLRFGLNFSYATGRPVTLPEYTYSLGNKELVYFSDRNKYRLPDYHRLDISMSIDESLKKKKKWKGSWTFSVLNVYARKNAYSIVYKKDTPTPENNYRVFSLYKMYLIGVPFPTITYNFIF